MFEFCDKCGGILIPTKDEDENILICKSCGRSIPLESEVIESYVFHTKIDHQPEKN
jgi:DNA-directed RNA polymerase subunit M/transcription elongation factor TFIIS